MVALLGPDHNDWLINSGVAMAIGADAIKAALPGLTNGTSHTDAPTLGLGVVIENQDGHEIVRGVTDGTGAAAAGIKAGDIIVSVDGHAASSSAAMSRAILRHHLGERVPVALLRAGKPLAVTVELREFNREPE
jgi:serine protease Do